MEAIVKVSGAGAVRRRAFRTADGFAVEAWKATRRLSGVDGGSLADEIRRRVGRSGAALLAASASEPGSDHEAERLRAARDGLLQARYLLYLARRLGALDVAAYRRLTTVHDGAERDLAAWARDGP
jgi:hypothetical protein